MGATTGAGIGIQVIAIDGKNLRGSYDRGWRQGVASRQCLGN
jgi:hypothetical protein